MSDYLEQYLEYIDNAGGKVAVEHFDEDWEPIGQMVRDDLFRAGLVQIDSGYLVRVAQTPSEDE